MAKIVITEADYQAALHKFTLLDWGKVKATAKRCAAERLLAANMAEQKRLIAESSAMVPSTSMASHLAWSKIQDRIWELFAEHDELLDIAYPRAKEE